MITWMVILAHLCGLESFGVPYLSPIAPLRMGSMGDQFYRRSWRNMILRPGLLAKRNTVRQKRVKTKENEEP